MKNENPTHGICMGHKSGKLNRSFTDHDNAPNIIDSQGKCSACKFYKAVILPSGYLRRLCSLTGIKLPSGGVDACEFKDISPWPDGEAVRPEGVPLTGAVAGGEA